MSDNSTPSPIPQPGQAQRYFGEKIVTGDYKRCLVIMVEEDGVIRYGMRRTSGRMLQDW